MSPFAAVLICCFAVVAPPALPNLDFGSGNLKNWEGQGFYLTTANPRGTGTALGACSSDAGCPSRTGMLRYVFTVPEGVGRIRFHAYGVLGPDCASKRLLDVLLLGHGKRVIPRKVRGAEGWIDAPELLTKPTGQAREYYWDVADLVGQTLQIVIVDQDDRPGCYVFSSGFRLEPPDDSERREFARFMLDLERDKKLPPLAAFESRHFLAWGNADEDFIAARLRDGEELYEQFFEHFRTRGFTVQPPARKLMVAIFDTQEGFEAYLGRKMPSSLLGVYHRTTNRFVVYDLHRNRGLAESRKKLLHAGRDIPIDLERIEYTQAVERHVRRVGDELNVATTMHEVAHQLSFNCGLLNRQGDVPLWLSEGLACYCEATEQGAWQGMGSANVERLKELSLAMRKGGKLVPLTALANDTWVKDSRTLGLAYAQSWALFRMLMEERPEAMRAYLKLIHPRRAPEQRWMDFRQAFGAEVERHHLEYIRDLLQRNAQLLGAK